MIPRFLLSPGGLLSMAGVWFFLCCPRETTSAQTLPEFSRFPVEKISTRKLEKIDWGSHPEARAFRTRLTELIGTRADFAGHYIVLEVGAGTMASRIFLVDVENGKVYLAPFVASLGVKYALNSRLLLENDPDAVQGYVRGIEGKRPDWLRVQPWLWDEAKRAFVQFPFEKK